MNIFEQSLREKVRFNSNKGDLTTEQLWDLPLTSKSSLDLDTLERGVNSELKDMQEESYVNPKPNAQKRVLELKLAILRHVIDSKLAEAVEAEKYALRLTEKKRLLQILSKKQDEKLDALSVEDIEKRLAELG